MTPRVIRVSLLKINGRYVMKGYNKFNILSSISVRVSYASRSKFNALACNINFLRGLCNFLSLGLLTLLNLVTVGYCLVIQVCLAG
jgi:hypothetical protein